MATPREQVGAFAQASRLLQEGLQLLDAREREVDTLLEQAREKALLIREEAERRAAEITFTAERQRAELDEQVAALRGEVAALREELAVLESPAAPTPQPVETVEPDQVDTVEEIADAGDHDVDRVADEREAELEPAVGASSWGRRSTVSSPQAIRTTKAGRPKWLPPWVPLG